MIDLKSIRAAAEAATPGPWHFGTFHKLLITDADNSKHFPIAEIEGSELPWDSTEESKRAYNNADHIATANPAAILELLDRLEAAEKDAARIRNEVIEECAIKSWSCGMDWHMRRNNTDVREVGSAIANEIRSMKK